MNVKPFYSDVLDIRRWDSCRNEIGSRVYTVSLHSRLAERGTAARARSIIQVVAWLWWRRWGWWRGEGRGRQRWRRWSRSADGRTWQVTWSHVRARAMDHTWRVTRSRPGFYAISWFGPWREAARTSKIGEIAATCSALEYDVNDTSGGKRVTRLTADLAALADSSPTSPPLSTNDPFDSFRQRARSPMLRFRPQAYRRSGRVRVLDIAL